MTHAILAHPTCGAFCSEYHIAATQQQQASTLLLCIIVSALVTLDNNARCTTTAAHTQDRTLIGSLLFAL
jgi:hypothetical protein